MDALSGRTNIHRGRFSLDGMRKNACSLARREREDLARVKQHPEKGLFQRRKRTVVQIRDYSSVWTSIKRPTIFMHYLLPELPNHEVSRRLIDAHAASQSPLDFHSFHRHLQVLASQSVFGPRLAAHLPPPLQPQFRLAMTHRWSLDPTRCADG